MVLYGAAILQRKWLNVTVTNVLLAAIAVLLASIAAALFSIEMKVTGPSKLERKAQYMLFGILFVLALLIGFVLVLLLGWMNEWLALW